MFHELLLPYAGRRLAEKKIREILNVDDYQEYCWIMQKLMPDHSIDPVPMV